MSQGVTYADLQFVRAPLEKTPQPLQERTGSADGDLTYENVHVTQPNGEEASSSSKQHKGPKKPSWPIALGLLGASLFLLATTVGFGVRYRQASRHLQEALEASAADSKALARTLHAQEQARLLMQTRLQEAEAELNRSRTALQESQRLASSTQEQLREKAALLATETQKRRGAEEALSATLAQACAGWCPEEWLLLGGKCLFFSTQTKTWAESKTDCEEKAAQLLSNSSVPTAAIPALLVPKEYWIGHFRRWSHEERNWAWVDSKRYKKPDYSSCAQLEKGQWVAAYCNKRQKYICEKPARPGGSDPSQLGWHEL